MSRLHQIFCASCRWPWLSSSVTALQYVLPVLWMMSCFHNRPYRAGNAAKGNMEQGAESDDAYDCLVIPLAWLSHAGVVDTWLSWSVVPVILCVYLSVSALQKENSLSYQHQTWHTDTLRQLLGMR